MNQHAVLDQAHLHDATAAKRAAAQERLSRARGIYNREESDANYRALLEAQQAWDRLRIEELVAENLGWRRKFREIIGKVRAARRDQELNGD